jgi:tRNA-2-methylthio-N6-dimethylallyladenosine synthase
MAEILAEVRHLVDFGFAEIELLGQTVNHWREPAGDRDFADLLQAVATLPGVQRLRFVTSYPRDFTPRMVEQVGTHANICPYLHLPVQSGSDRILRLMGRGYVIADYERLVEDLRRARPGLALSTDLIAGFPGEADEDHELTLELVQRVRFAQLFAFKYSSRPGTPALRLREEAVPNEVADRRLQEIFEAQKPIQRALNEALVGDTVDVLVTGWGRVEGQQLGRTPCHRIVCFEAGRRPADAGALVRIRIDEALPHSLLGSRIDLEPDPAAGVVSGSRLRVIDASS